MQNDGSSRLILDMKPSAKQREFFLSEAKFTAYGGARGGGKSFALRYKLILLCLGYPGIRALLVRRSMPRLTLVFSLGVSFFESLPPQPAANTNRQRLSRIATIFFINKSFPSPKNS